MLFVVQRQSAAIITSITYVVLHGLVASALLGAQLRRLDDLDTRGTSTVPASDLQVCGYDVASSAVVQEARCAHGVGKRASDARTHLGHGPRQRHVPVLLVHVDRVCATIVAHPDAKVLHLERLLLEDLREKVAIQPSVACPPDGPSLGDLMLNPVKVPLVFHSRVGAGDCFGPARASPPSRTTPSLPLARHSSRRAVSEAAGNHSSQRSAAAASAAAATAAAAAAAADAAAAAAAACRRRLPPCRRAQEY